MTANRREPWDVVFGVLLLVSAVLLGAGLFAYFATHPIVAALWALGTTAGTVWFGTLYGVRRHDDRMRALTAERQRRAVPATEPETVAELLLSCRTGRRIGDAEREVFLRALHAHFAAGRLAAGELDERIAGVLAALTIDGLALTVEGLPSEVTGR